MLQGARLQVSLALLLLAGLAILAAAGEAPSSRGGRVGLRKLSGSWGPVGPVIMADIAGGGVDGFTIPAPARFATFQPRGGKRLSVGISLQGGDCPGMPRKFVAVVDYAPSGQITQAILHTQATLHTEGNADVKPIEIDPREDGSIRVQPGFGSLGPNGWECLQEPVLLAKGTWELTPRPREAAVRL